MAGLSRGWGRKSGSPCVRISAAPSRLVLTPANSSFSHKEVSMQPTIPGYLTPIVLVVSVTLAGWLYRVTAEGAGHASLPATTRSRFRLGTGAFLAARSSPVLNQAGQGVVPASFLLFGGVTVSLAIGLLAFSPGWRKVVKA